ncbi:MAG: tetratricopeptide repeat protein, partial [Candidatus Limnocylindria bacterium]
MPSDTARLLRDAEEHDVLGQYARAAEVLDGLIASLRPGAGSAAVLATALARRAGLLRYEGLLEPARQLLDEATVIAEADPDIEPEVACQLDVELGRWHLEVSGPDAADGHLARAVELARSFEDDRTRAIELATSLAAFGASKRVRGDYKAAQGMLMEAVQHAQVASDADPSDRRAAIELVHALDELGVLNKFSGDFKESEAAYMRALDLLTTVAGPDHPDVATIQHNLGGLAHARGDGPAAEVFARRSVQLHERSLGADHLATVLDRSALAAVLDQRGATADAEAMLRDCAERIERTLGASHRELAVVLNNLAAVAQRG